MANVKDVDWSNIALGMVAVGVIMFLTGKQVEKNYWAPRRMKREQEQLASKKPQVASKK